METMKSSSSHYNDLSEFLTKHYVNKNTGSGNQKKNNNTHTYWQYRIECIWW